MKQFVIYIYSDGEKKFKIKGTLSEIELMWNYILEIFYDDLRYEMLTDDIKIVADSNIIRYEEIFKKSKKRIKKVKPKPVKKSSSERKIKMPNPLKNRERQIDL